MRAFAFVTIVAGSTSAPSGWLPAGRRGPPPHWGRCVPMWLVLTCSIATGFFLRPGKPKPAPEAFSPTYRIPMRDIAVTVHAARTSRLRLTARCSASLDRRLNRAGAHRQNDGTVLDRIKGVTSIRHYQKIPRGTVPLR